jgi:iron complex outermembrane receptor protein
MTFRKRTIAASLSIIGSTTLALVPSVMADDAPGSITVTAQSRSQQSQSVPIPLQVVTADTVDKLGATNLGDMNGYIPGLEVSNEQPTQPNFTLRGLGASDFGIGTDSPVGVYIDGVSAGKTGGSLMNFNDVARIEVLKGPQGTLFGRNSAAGAISIISNEPDVVSAETSAKIKLGQYGGRTVDVLLNRPLNDDTAFRLSAVSDRSSGWIRDAATGEKLNGQNNRGVRASLLTKLGNAGKVVLMVEHEEISQKARPAIGLVAMPDAPALPAIPADPNTFLDPRTAPVYNDAALNHEGRVFNGATLRVEAPLGWADFKSTTAFRQFHSVNAEDNDGTNRKYTYLSTVNLEKNASLQQEFKLSGRNAQIDWVGGVSFFREGADQTSQVNVTTDTLDTLSNNVIGMPIYSTIAQLSGVNLLGNPWQEAMYNHADNKAYAAYGDVIWHLTPSTNVTAGLRFTRDEKDFRWYQPNRTAGVVDAGVGALTAGGFFDQVAQLMGPDAAAQLQGFLTTNQLLTSPGATTAPLNAHNSWNDFSPRIVLDHILSPDMMLYASVSKGYQAGGYNALQQIGSKFDPETVWNYELGTKNYYRNLHLLVNASLFSYRFTNLQQLNLVNVNTSGVPQYQVTTSDQKATGLDFDLRWQPTTALRMTLGGEYINQTYGHNLTADGLDLSNQAVGTPFWTVAAGVDYTWQGVFGGQLAASVQDAWQGATRCNADALQGSCLQTPRFTVGTSTNRTDVRLRWDAPDRRWNVALIVNNLFDKRYVEGIGNIGKALGTPYASVSAPRVTAVEFGFKM